jgi:hypothetical protein
VSMILRPHRFAVAATLQLVSATASTWGDEGNPATKTITGISVLNGDFLVVLGAGEDSGFTVGTPSGGGLTYTSRQTNATASNCWSGGWTAPVTTDSSLSVACVCHAHSGFVVFVYRNGAYGTSAKETNTTEAPSLSLTTTAAGSMLAFLQADWNALSGARTWRTVNVAADEVVYSFNSGTYTVYAANWSNTGAAGAKTPGLSAPTGQKTSMIGVEVASL